MKIKQIDIVKGEREWASKQEACLAADDLVGYWKAYLGYLLWCKETSHGYISPCRARLIVVIEKTIKQLESSGDKK